MAYHRSQARMLERIALGEIHETAAHVSESLQVVISRDEIGEDVVFGAEGQGPPMVAFKAECCIGIRASSVVLLWNFYCGCCCCCLAAAQI